MYKFNSFNYYNVNSGTAWGGGGGLPRASEFKRRQNKYFKLKKTDVPLSKKFEIIDPPPTKKGNSLQDCHFLIWWFLVGRPLIRTPNDLSTLLDVTTHTIPKHKQSPCNRKSFTYHTIYVGTFIIISIYDIILVTDIAQSRRPFFYRCAVYLDNVNFHFYQQMHLLLDI